MMNKIFAAVSALVIAILVIVGVWLGLSYVERLNHFTLSNSHMAPNILDHETVEVDSRAFFHRMPERGEIVLYHPADDDSYKMVGRIVAVPGDEVSFRSGKLILNAKHVHEDGHIVDGKMIDEPNLEFEEVVEVLGNRRYNVWYMPDAVQFPQEPVKLGEDEFFIVGDNRDKSKDSRYTGPVPRAKILAKVKKIVESQVEYRTGSEFQ